MTRDEMVDTLLELKKQIEPLTKDTVHDPHDILLDIALSADRYIETLDTVADVLGNFDPGWFE